MADVFKTIGGIFTNPIAGPIASGASLGLGEIGNLLAGRAADKQASDLAAQEKRIQNLTPAQLTGLVTSAEKPIDNALVQSINNSVQADMASRGLAEAPGIFAAGESQALAPYVQQNYQTALNQVLQQLGLPLSYANTLAQFLPKQQNLTPAMQLFLQQLSRLKGANASGGSGFPTTGPNLPDYGATPPIIGDTGGTGGSGGGGVYDALNSLLTQGASA